MLVLAATPIGQVGDAPPRLAAELAGADVVAAEDTRRLKRLTSDLGITLDRPGRVLLRGQRVGPHAACCSRRCSPASGSCWSPTPGMPSVSDPGYRLVAAAVEHDVHVTAVPGPCAVLTALAVSGLPVDRFCFEGFLPRKAGERARRLAGLAREERTMVFFEAPHRTEAALAAMAEAFGGDRAGAVCRELTKTHEEVRRGPLAELVALGRRRRARRGDHRRRGAPRRRRGRHRPGALRAAVAEEEAAGATRKEAIVDVARRAGVPKREVYDVVHEQSSADRARAARGHRGEVRRRRDRERPPAPEPLPHPVVDNHCHLDIADGETGSTTARGASPRRPRSA